MVIKKPIVSVIIPVYNGTNYLSNAIDSVLSQTFTDYEIIVVDDGSTDDTWRLIESYGSKVRGIHKNNGGVASALNLGISKAYGEWIAWLSHDDLFMPEKLGKQVLFSKQNKDIMACYTDFVIIDKNGEFISKERSAWYPPEQMLRKLFGVCFINGSSMLINKNCFNEVGLFHEEYKFTQDAQMWLRIANKYKIGKINEYLLKWRWHPSQGSNKIIVHMKEEQIMYINTFEELGYSSVFPELRMRKDEQYSRARGYELIGDIMLKERKWYDFSKYQYIKSIEINPNINNTARFKLGLIHIRTLGLTKKQEMAELYIRQGKFLAGRGFIDEGKSFFRQALLINPLALSAFMYWIILLIGKKRFLQLRTIKKWVSGKLRSNNY